jgi:hypothetical protein
MPTSYDSVYEDITLSLCQHHTMLSMRKTRGVSVDGSVRIEAERRAGRERLLRCYVRSPSLIGAQGGRADALVALSAEFRPWSFVS